MADSGTSRRRSRDDVADAALRLLAEHGLPELTMRQLADALGVQPSALYWHFPNKQALLAAVSERVLAPVARGTATSGPARDSLLALGTRLRSCLLAYRDGAELVSSSLALGLVEPPLRAPLGASARAEGVSEDLARIAADTVTHFVVGHVFHEQQRMQAGALGLLPDDADVGADFDAALAMIVDGFHATVEAAAPAHP